MGDAPSPKGLAKVCVFLFKKKFCQQVLLETVSMNERTPVSGEVLFLARERLGVPFVNPSPRWS